MKLSITPDNAADVPFEQKTSPENIPEELKKNQNWVLWKLEPRKDKGGKPVYDEDGTPKMTKVPYQINGKKAKPNDPKTWTNFFNVLSTFENKREHYSGIGFVMSTDVGIVGIDFDHVRNPATGEWNKKAWEEIKELNSYTELSPSGSGCHVFVKGKMVEDGRRKEQPDGTDREMYQNLHFLTVTGNKVKGLPDAVNEAQAEINTFFYVWFQQERSGGHLEEIEEIEEIKMKGGGNLEDSDAEIIYSASNYSKNSYKFKQLYKGGHMQFAEYPSQSEADLAFCSILAQHGADEEQIERIFKSSGLYREEKGSGYIKRTIETAIKGLKQIKQAAKGRHGGGRGKGREKEKTEEETVDPVSKYPEEIRENAYKILKECDAFQFIMETWNIRHVGDKNLGENCLCAVASTYILNSEMGLHIKPSGESGKGKSDAMQNILNLLPPHKYISGSLSAKALFYDESLKSGTIIYSDDASLGDDLIATIKQSTSKFQETTYHRTVKNQEIASFSIPARTSWWFSTVDGIGDEQLANRFLNADVDGSREQDLKVLQHIKQKEALNLTPDDEDVLICHCVFDILDKERYLIKIPYIDAIEWRNTENRRNFQKFLDILRAVTLYNVFQRPKVKGCYLADYADFQRALEIYTGTAKNNATNLTKLELDVLNFIAGRNQYDTDGNLKVENPVTLKDLQNKFDFSRQRARAVLHGRDGNGGMLAKVAQLISYKESTTSGGQNEDKKTTHQNYYLYTGRKLGLEIYDTVATIDLKEAPEKINMFMKTLLEEGATTATMCNHDATIGMVAPKKNTVERIDNNATIKREKDKHTPSLLYCVYPFILEEVQESISHFDNGGCRVAPYPPTTDSSKVARGLHMVAVVAPSTGDDFSGCTPKCNQGATHDQDGCIQVAPKVVEIAGVAPAANTSKLAVVALAEDDMETMKKLNFLREELKVQSRTYIRKHGGIDNIEKFVDVFLRENPGFRNSWSLDIIMSEAEKVCKKVPSERTNVSDQEDSGEVESMAEG